MLTQLTLRHYALIQELQIDFSSGMTVITGETGAGKSILIDALALCLGERADASLVRAPSQQAELIACFQVTESLAAYQWLFQQQLLLDDDHCILRRTLNVDGRSRCYVNGVPVTRAQLRALGQQLVQIHGQHAHQQLLKNTYQCTLLDQFAQHQQLLTTMRQSYQIYIDSQQIYQQQQLQATTQAAQRELLEYQLAELKAVAAQPEEYQTISGEHRQLAQRNECRQCSQQLLDLLYEQEQFTLLGLAQQAIQQMRQLASLDNRCSHLLAMLEEAAIQISETRRELQSYSDQLNLDPERFTYLEQRLASLIQLARKHHVPVESLPEQQQRLQQAWESLIQQENGQQQLQQQLEEQERGAQTAAEVLTAERQQAAQQLAQRLTTTLQQLALPHAQFAITVTPKSSKNLSAQGWDDVEFWITTNPGQSPQPLNKVASGGELSRIALAIQLLTASKNATPALIFDEIDSGISGYTALTVGQHLRQLAEITQVFCVTHLPQVASCGHHHLLVKKQTQHHTTTLQLHILQAEQRVEAIARLLAGAVVTPQAIANARELLTAN
ncbi:MAG: DNA repair protein RecN [Candidatus Symbiodolus clandestinus]